MTNMSGSKISWTPETVIHDIFLLASLYCFFTGFIPFAPEKFYQIAAQKPAIHRLILMVFTLSGFFWAAARYSLAPKAGLGETPLVFLLTRRLPPIKLCVLVIFLFSSWFWASHSIARHLTFQSGFDRAIFTQAVWNTTQGSFLYSSIKGGINLLGDHFSPLLAVFALPYKIWPDPVCLLSLQALLAASSFFPLYRMGRNKFGDNVWALTPVIALACYLPLRNAVAFEFHPEVAALPLFFWAYYFWDRSRLPVCSVFLFLGLLSKESAFTVTFAFGLLALVRRKWFFGIFWTIFSIVYFYIIINKAIPALSGQPYQYLSGNFLAWKDQGIGEFFRHVASPASAAYVFKIFMPLGFLPFGDLSILLALPALAQNLTSRNELTLSIFTQYTAFLTPFIFCSLVETLKRFHPRYPAVLGYLLFSTIFMAGVSDNYDIQTLYKSMTPHMRQIPRVLSIPEDASVRTHEALMPFLANRKELHMYENNHPREGGSEKALKAEYVVLDLMFLHGHAPEMDVIKNYNMVQSGGGLMVYKRK